MFAGGQEGLDTRLNHYIEVVIHNNHADNRPPNITGRFILNVRTGDTVSEIYNADDPDGDSISTFYLKVCFQ